MNKKVVIIGGGIIGLCSAYYLIRQGHEVIVIDQSDMKSGASHVNAGYITPSHIIPLSSPGIITKGLKWMFNSASPFYVKPRLDSDFLKWSWAFKKSATQEKVEKAIPIIKEINLLSRDLYEDLKASNEFDFHYERNGLLMLCQTEKALANEWVVGKRSLEAGLSAIRLSAEETKKYEPNIDLNVEGAVYYDCDAHMTPSIFMKNMVDFLSKKGVVFYTNEEVIDIAVSNELIQSIRTENRSISADEYVLATGAWSSHFAKKVGLKIPIQAGKGYRINVDRDTGISTPAILVEAKVAVTPMNGFTRFAGTMEIGGINHKINPKRVNAIANAAENYYKNLSILKEEKSKAACGLRPCSPDGLPFIGKSNKCKNLTIAAGHAMMGWSLGPATGKLVSEIISEQKTSMHIDAFHPDRTFK